MTKKLEAKGLTVIRGESCLFQDVGFALGPGELLILEGENGSGKTSLIRAIAGLMSLESGEVTWNGVDITRQRQVFHDQLAWFAHKTGLKSDLTVAENLRFERALRPQSGLDEDDVLERLGLERLKGLAVRSLSAGQQRRVALARMALADVPLWLLDEPFTNLDSHGRELVVDLVRRHVGRGGLCVVASHQDLGISSNVKRLRLG